MTNHKRVIEAALFMAPEPLSVKELARIAGIGSIGHVKGTLDELRENYENRGMSIVEGPNGWEMQVKKDILPKVAHLAPYADMPEGCRRTLALVICKEPAYQSEIVKIQGNKAYSYIKKLIKMGLLSTEKAGRTKILNLTREFENYFGEEKEKIKERLTSEISKKGKKEIKTEKETETKNKEEPEEPEKKEKKSLKESLREAEEKLDIPPEKSKPKQAEKDEEIKF